MTARSGMIFGEARPLVRQAEAEGWRVAVTKRGHLRMYAPDGKTMVGFSGTPSDWRSLRNFRAKLRAAGVAV